MQLLHAIRECWRARIDRHGALSCLCSRYAGLETQIELGGYPDNVRYTPLHVKMQQTFCTRTHSEQFHQCRVQSWVCRSEHIHLMTKSSAAYLERISMVSKKNETVEMRTYSRPPRLSIQKPYSVCRTSRAWKVERQHHQLGTRHEIGAETRPHRRLRNHDVGDAGVYVLRN